jgi:hypothetical protein
MKSKTNIVLAHAAFEGNADPAQAGAIAVNQRQLSIKSFGAKAWSPGLAIYSLLVSDFFEQPDDPRAS